MKCILALTLIPGVKEKAVDAHEKSPNQATRDRLEEAKEAKKRESKACTIKQWN